MKVLVACEFSGAVRRAFRARGHHAYSVDLLEDESPYPDNGPPWHFQMSLEDFISGPGEGTWDLIIAFPPCTHLASSGARWFSLKRRQQAQAIRFVEWIWQLPATRLAIENPIGVLSTRSQLGKPTQIIQPWQFGHGETKATCLWLKNLPPLQPTAVVAGREARVHTMPPSLTRWKERSRTLPGVAAAMAEQWG